ncbi:MAG: phosphopantetheine-binding protein [Elusimicrobiota bacterium]|jgi:acyl carrier protein|nr:phosphopantetheine-binding protein [Elusimicrobiota bacterium]
MDRKKILEKVKKELIYDRLKLEDIGIDYSEVTDDVELFGDEKSLGLTSVDALEIAMGIQKEYDVKIIKLDEETVKEKFKTPNTITDFIIELLKQKENMNKDDNTDIKEDLKQKDNLKKDKK